LAPPGEIPGDFNLGAGQGFSGLSLKAAAGFNGLRAGLLAQAGKVWMFDNEIDWVTHLEF
jgi:hypothetical protein